MRSLFFLIREALVNLRRHGFMTAAAITTIAVALSLLGAFLITFYEIDVASHQAVADFEMRVFCRTDIPKADLKALGAKIGVLPGVGSVSFLSKEKIWAEQTKNYPIDVSGIPNQMNDTFVVKMKDANQAGAVASTIETWKDDIQEVDLPKNEMNGVLKIASFLRTVGLVSGGILLIGALVVVSNTIRVSVFARRREIRIMQIVGAAPWFIRLPLLLEGLIHGTLGGTFACIGLYFAGRYIGGLIQETVPMLLHYGGSVNLGSFALSLVGAGAVIGAGGSLLSIHRYLRTV